MSGNDIKGSDNDITKSLAAKELIANQISLFNVRTQIVSGSKVIFTLKAEQVQASILNELGFELTTYQK